MERRWFTVMFSEPDSTVNVEKARRAPDGNFVAWDGEAGFIETQQAASKLAKHCGRVWVFVGKEIGRLIATYTNGVYVE